MFETKPVRITELAKETEQYLLQKGCKKSTLGVYKATWHKFMHFRVRMFIRVQPQKFF